MIMMNGGLNKKNNIMKTIKRIIKQYKENKNLIPFNTVVLDSGIICKHYKNGKIKVEVL